MADKLFRFKIKQVLEVLDGDTVDVMLDLGFSIYTPKRVRLNGIDAPEAHTTVLREKACGLKVKEYVKKFLSEPSQLTLLSYSLDGEDEKYGRVLGDIGRLATGIEGDEMYLVGSLLAQKLVRPYTGDKKKKWLADEMKIIEAFKLL